MYYIINNKWVYSSEPNNELSRIASDIISQETFELYQNNPMSWTVENGKFVKLKPEEEVKADLIRSRRTSECFPIINRGALWYDKLTEEQKTELSAWYEAWLDAPETGTAPTAPVWLNEVAGQEKAI